VEDDGSDPAVAMWPELLDLQWRAVARANR